MVREGSIEIKLVKAICVLKLVVDSVSSVHYT